MANPIIPIFFAADEKYLPYLAVCLTSVKANASRAYDYHIYVLHAGMDEEAQKTLATYDDEQFTVRFVDISADLSVLAEKLCMRHYYTKATYYRIFIAGLFPQYDKALYLDSDVVVRGDISELYETDIDGYMVGAIVDGAVSEIKPLQGFTGLSLGVPHEQYFNAGVLVMNLKKFREIGFYEKFATLLGQYAFVVAQDQDYLNVLCKNQVKYIPSEWNAMPTGNHKAATPPKLIHYNLTAKPWHYDNILYQEVFWEYAKQTAYYDDLLAELHGYTDEDKANDKACEEGLIALAISEESNENNYIRKYGIK